MDRVIKGLLDQWCECESSVSFLYSRFMFHRMTEIRSENYAGFLSGGHKCKVF